MSAPRRLILIHNPAAGQRRRRRLEQILALLRAHGCSVELRPTAGPGDAERLSAAVTAADCDVLVVAGGDGTINEAVNGLVRAGHAVPPLAVLPVGTANVLAAEIGLPFAPRAVARCIAEGRPRRVHLGRANGRHFVLMAGVGLDARVVAEVSLPLKKLAGKVAYVAETLAQLARYRCTPCTVTVDGAAYQADSVVACNGRFYGGHFVAAPKGCLESAGFEVCLLTGAGAWNALRYGAALVLGRLPLLPDVRIVAGRDIVIEGEPGAPVQGDGDIVARLPVRITVADECLSLIYPP